MGQHVLVVDDNRELAESIACLLELVSPTRLTTALAFNGSEAVIAVMSASPPDVIVMDLEMPVMDGLSAAVAIRTAMGTRKPHLIAVSGSPAHIALAKAGGMFDHSMQKPVEIDDLLAVLAKARS